MTRRLEELELKRYMKCKCAETVQVKPCPIYQSYEHLVEESYNSTVGKCLEIKQMSLTIQAQQQCFIGNTTTQVGGTIQISLEAKSTSVYTASQPSQQASNLEQAIVNLSKIDDLQYSISRLTNLNTVQEKGDFLLNLTKTPRVSMKWKLMRRVFIEEEEEETEKREEIKGKKKDSSEGKEDHDSTVNETGESTYQGDVMKKHTPPHFPQALHGKKGIRNA
ncbi:hypothetical protein CK203_089751 [Vitis vinifera]|uniref:Uncharacterized protein n=1 Tax=Vitis vinifera TaxID=29760 RepID=A0A438BLE3_VITVI|nr:hypothetical protein CK203_089751 [Vitis vinifera]